MPSVINWGFHVQYETHRSLASMMSKNLCSQFGTINKDIAKYKLKLTSLRKNVVGGGGSSRGGEEGEEEEEEERPDSGTIPAAVVGWRMTWRFFINSGILGRSVTKGVAGSHPKNMPPPPPLPSPPLPALLNVSDNRRWFPLPADTFPPLHPFQVYIRFYLFNF